MLLSGSHNIISGFIPQAALVTRGAAVGGLAKVNFVRVPPWELEK